MANGKLITFEGIDGSGKSTQAKLLYERLRSAGINCAIFREPGGTPLGEQVRNILLNQPEQLGSLAELLLFSAARAELVRTILKPLLSKGCVVILDRFVDSTTAYQGYGRGIELDVVRSVNDAAVQGIAPEATFLFDLSAEVALKRHDRAHDRIEKEGAIFMEKVRQGYLAEAVRNSERMMVLDAQLPVDELATKVWSRLET